MSTHRMYVCPRCGWGHYHPLFYCVRCPGRLEAREVSQIRFATETEASQWLKQHGVDYIGEYPKIEKSEEIKVSIARYKECLLNSQLRCCMQSHRDGYHPERSVAYWKREIAKLEAELTSLG